MKIKLKKILICLLIIMTLNNFFIGSISENAICSYATEVDPNEEKINGIFGTVVGLLTWPIRVVALAAGLAVNKLMSAVAYAGEGTLDGLGILDIIQLTITPFDILFNKFSILNINFFKMPDDAQENSIVYQFRSSVAIWYYAMRTIASAILLCILIYVGIRMAISTASPQQKASYKKMLGDWVISLVIIFLIQYIMIFVMYVNDGIIAAIGSIQKFETKDILNDFAVLALKGMSIQSIAATVIYCMMVFQTFGLFISYFNRMLKLAFLTIIAPLITLTYSIDKIGDGKAQALNTWLKEYIFTILIQPFHCIIYMCFISVAFGLFKSGQGSLSSLAAAIIAILCVNFIRDAEDLVRKIFSFADDNKSTSIGAGLAVATIAASKAKNLGKTSRKAVSGLKNLSTGVGHTMAEARVEAAAMKRILLRDNKDANGNRLSAEELKSEERSRILTEKAKKIENNDKNGVRYTADTQKTVDDRAKQIMKTTGMSAKEAKAHARLQIAKENRDAKAKTKKDQKKEKFYSKHKDISRVRGTIKDLKELADSSEVLQQLSGMKDAYIAGGMGLAFGSGMYGLRGNVVESTIAGIAMGSGTKEFLKTSDKILIKDANSRLKSLGAKNKTEAALKTNNIMANKDKYEGNDELNKIIKEIEDALTHAGIDKNKKTSIQNTIQTILSNNPGADLSKVVDNALELNEVKGAQRTKAIEQSTTNLVEFTQEQGIYNDIKSAGNSGITPDAFIAGIIKKYDPPANTSQSISIGDKTNKEFLDESKDITQNEDDRDTKFVAPETTDVEEFIKDKNEVELNEFYKYCDKEYKKVHEEALKAETEEIRKDFAAQMNQILATKAKVKDAELDREIIRIREEYQRLHDEANATVDKLARAEVERSLEDLQQQYDKYIGLANSQIGRGEMEGIKTQIEIKNQKRELEVEKIAIDSLRRILKS